MAGYDRIKRVFSLFGTRRDIYVRYNLPSSVLTISYGTYQRAPAPAVSTSGENVEGALTR